MKINKNPIVTTILVVLIAVVLIVGTIFLTSRNDTTNPGIGTGSSGNSYSSDAAPETSSPSRPQNDIPDVNANQTSPETPYDEVNLSGMSTTTLTDDEIVADIKDVLTGLLRLDAKSIERVSVQTISGNHNPFRVMLDAVSSDATMKSAFLNMSSVSSFEILYIEMLNKNAYTITISATTPYMPTQTALLAATDQIVQVQELTVFRETGAAQAIAEMDIGSVPLSTDLVTLTVIVHDDIPVLYHPNSFIYGNNNPQYAFLWGGINFQGTQRGDLLLGNDIGNGVVLTDAEIASNVQLALIKNYLDTSLSAFKKADIAALHDIELSGDTLGSHWTLNRTYPEYQGMYDQYPDLEQDVMNRLKSFEYEITCYVNTEKETGASLYTIATTYSVVDQTTNKRIYNTRYYYLNQSSRKTLNQSEANFVNNLVDSILEDALGGEQIAVVDRLIFTGQWEY